MNRWTWKTILFDRWLSLVVALAFASLMVTVSNVLGGLMAIPAFTIAFFGGLLVWLPITFRQPVGADGLVIPTLLSVMIFIGHVAEEYYTEFYIDIARLRVPNLPSIFFWAWRPSVRRLCGRAPSCC